MRTEGLSDEQALARLNARLELHYLRRTGGGGAHFGACMTRLLLGVLLTASCIFAVAYVLSDSPWILVTALVGGALSTGWVWRYDSTHTKERIALLQHAFFDSE